MKKTLKIILIILLFVIGLGIFIAPKFLHRYQTAASKSRISEGKVMLSTAYVSLASHKLEIGAYSHTGISSLGFSTKILQNEYCRSR